MNIWVDANGWPFPPTILLGCLIVESLYFRGLFLLLQGTRREGSVGLTPADPFLAAATPLRKLWFWRGGFFLGGLITLLVASFAPIDALSGRWLWVHMIQHLLLLIVMAPLIVAGAPLIPLWLGLPAWARRALRSLAKHRIVGRALYLLGHWLQLPAIACALLIVGTWSWHWPALYDLALTNDTIHDWLEHLTFIVVSVIFWAQLIPSPPVQRSSYLKQIACVGVAVAQNVVLAVLIAFAPASLYAPYTHLAVAGGFSALQDQQLGAGIMWTFGDLPFGIALSVLIQRWLASQPDDTPVAVKS